MLTKQRHDLLCHNFFWEEVKYVAHKNSIELNICLKPAQPLKDIRLNIMHVSMKDGLRFDIYRGHTITKFRKTNRPTILSRSQI